MSGDKNKDRDDWSTIRGLLVLVAIGLLLTWALS